MALIVRVDVDRPYGKHPTIRHLLSRISSDFIFPKLEQFGYLRELEDLLGILNQAHARAHVFFRRCTLPSSNVMELLTTGGHEIGLHLENSRTFRTFLAEKAVLEQHVGKTIKCFSKHGSGGARFGRHHYAPYEPNKYMNWGVRAGMTFFSGNFEDPITPPIETTGFVTFMSAFWLEPYWRNTDVFTIDWLLKRAAVLDIVLLVHPENVLESAELTAQFRALITCLPTRIVA